MKDKESLKIILEDFGKISRKCFKLREKEISYRGDAMKSLGYSMLLHDFRFDNEGGFVWYDGREGYMPEVPIGNPEDYLPIRDDYKALKEFVSRTLDRGRLRAGGGTHGDSSRETNCADYVIWLQRSSENQSFRQNIERATSELLKEAFERKYAPVDISPSLQKEEKYFQKVYSGNVDKWLTTMFYRDNLHGALWRLGLNNPLSDEDRKFRTKFEAEARKTERPITLEEVFVQYSGAKEQLKQSLEKGQFSKVTRPHCTEMPDEFKAEVKDWYLNDQAKKNAVEAFSPQFNRLIGLLDIVSATGKKNNRFAEVYALLRQKAEEKFMIDSPTIAHNYSATNIYRSMLIALASVQQDTELQQFWLDSMHDDPDSSRVIASVHGALTMHDSVEEKRKLISPILQKIKERGDDLDKEYQRHSLVGFYSEENLLDDILTYMTSSCFNERTFKHLDKENATLDFLQSRDIMPEGYTFRFTRYTPQGKQDLEARFDFIGDKVEGGKQLEASVRSYLQKDYELPNKVWITSLEGRKINGTDAKIVAASGNNLNMQYEGIIGLNHTHFAFVYNPESQTTLLSEPLDSSCLIFGERGNLESRKMGIDKIGKQVPYSQFQSLAQTGKRVNKLVVERRKTALGDSLFKLDKKLSENLAPYLASIIHSGLILKGELS